MSVVVVTGAASGIGAACQRGLADVGHAVIGWDIADREAPVDVADLASLRAAAGRLPEVIDGAVLAAGVSEMAPLLETTEQTWRRQMDINAFGVFASMQVLVPRMRPGGSLAVIASVAGFKPAPLLAAYVASKFAVVGLVKAAAMELGPKGIRVNAICPGFIHTPMQDREVVWEGAMRGMTTDEVRDGYVAMTPMGRLGLPGDVAGLARFLMSADSGFVTGAVLTVSGGADSSQSGTQEEGGQA